MPPAVVVSKTSRIAAPALLGYHLACSAPGLPDREVVKTEDELRAFDEAVRAATGKDLDFPLKQYKTGLVALAPRPFSIPVT